MTLDQYLQNNKLTPAAFAAQIDVSDRAVDHYLKGKRTPKKSILNKIKEVTAGAVTADDFIHEGGNA